MSAARASVSWTSPPCPGGGAGGGRHGAGRRGAAGEGRGQRARELAPPAVPGRGAGQRGERRRREDVARGDGEGRARCGGLLLDVLDDAVVAERGDPVR